jgi:hypothetical protein
VVYGAEVVAVFTRNNSKLIVRMARVGVYLGGKVVVAFGRPPIALLVLVDEFGFAVTGEITKVD